MKNVHKHYVSDLHLDNWGNFPVFEGGKLLILAGDIFQINRMKYHLPFLKHISTVYDNVLYVPGNHEFYGVDINQEFDIPFDNIHVLRNDIITIDDVHYYGGTGWTDLSWTTDIDRKFLYERMIADYTTISNNGSRLTTNDTDRLFDRWYEGLIEFSMMDGEKVVITHFPPSNQSIAEQFKNSSINDYFVNDLDEQIKGMDINYWICGHVHHVHKYKIGNIQVLSNPLGYPHEYINQRFNLEILDI